MDQLRELDEDDAPGPQHRLHCGSGGGPWHSLASSDQGQPGSVRLGSKQRRIWAAEVDSTSAVAESIAQDKDLCKRLLASAGVPVPIGRPVTDLEDAWAVACEIGVPVVVKPQDGNQGRA